MTCFIPFSVRSPRIERAVEGAALGVAVVEVGHFALHAAVEADPLLHHGEALRQRLSSPRRFGIILGLMRLERLADGAVVDPHLVAHLAAQEPVDRQPGGFAGDVPEGHARSR